MFAFTKYTVSLTYTLLLVILRNTLGKNKNMYTKQSLQENRPRFNICTDETEEDTSRVQVSKLTYISKNII